ncbi:hypothetical protein RUM43_004962 [Polyplax serrata]|uniref:Netrin receptor UNC5A-D-like N-terminal domain-containing protein n=1 Tax=Polyplax serrata TaxID=468196 RepID=A0AAN8SBI8_POLSC
MSTIDTLYNIYHRTFIDDAKESLHLEDPIHPQTIPTGEEDQHSAEPMLLETPQDAYVVKNKPATLKCRAAHALRIYFKCNGVRKLPPDNEHIEFVEPQTGVRNIEASVTVTRNEVDEFFEKDKFRCVCVAWSSRGEIESQPAVIEVACKLILICNLVLTVRQVTEPERRSPCCSANLQFQVVTTSKLNVREIW